MLQSSMAMGDWWAQIADLQTLWNTGWANCDSLLPYMWAAGDNSSTQALARSSSILCIQVSTQDCSLLPSVGRSFLSEGVSDEFLPARSIIQAIGGLHCTRDMWIDEVLCKEEALRRHTWNWLQERTRILCRYFYDHLDIIHWLSLRACLH
jgi:hypothetical protein